MIDPNRPYWRTEIDQAFAKRKAKMHSEAVKRGGNGIALFQDCYTGKILRGGDSYDYEHIRSSEEIFITYRANFTNEQIAEIVNCPENVGVTLRRINQSKGKRKMEDWLQSVGHLPEFEINLKHTSLSLKKADEGILKVAKNIN